MRNKFQQLADFTNEGLIYQEADGEITYWNRKAKELFRLNDAQTVWHESASRSWHLVFEDGSICSDDQYPARISLDSGQSISNQIRGIKWEDSMVTWLSINTQPIFDEGHKKPSAVLISVKDITEDKRNETEILQARAIFYNTPVGVAIYRHEPPDRLILVNSNPAAAKLTGLDREGWIGREFNELWPRAKELGITAKYLKVMQSGEPYNADRIIYSDDGLNEVFRAKAFKLLDDHLAVAFENITSQWQAENALASSEERYRLLAENISDVIFMTDANIELTYISPSIESLLGYTPAEFMELPRERYLPPEYLQNLQELVDQRLEEGTDRSDQDNTLTRRWQFIHKNGSLVWVELVTSPWRIEDGVFKGMVGVIREVTDWVRAENSLRESEERYRSLVQLSPEGIYVSRDGCFLYANPEALRIWGAETLEDLSGLQVWDLIHPTQVARAKARHRNMVERGETTPVQEFSIVRLDSSQIEVEATSCPIPYPGGPAVQTTLRDITEKKRAQRALDEQTQLVHSIIQSVDEGIVVLDRELRYQVWNPFMEKLSGKTSQEVLGRKPEEMFPFLEEEGVIDRLKLALQGYPQPSVELPYHLQDLGISGWTRYTGLPLYDSRGEIIGVLSVVQEITQRKLAEQELKDQKVHLERLFHTSPEAIVLSDPQRRVTRINKGFTRLFGYSEDEALGQDIVDLIGPEAERQNMHSNFEMAMAGNEMALEAKRARKDGSLVDISVLTAPIIVDGEQVGVYGIFRDISARLKAQEEKDQLKAQLQHAQKMEAIGTLAGGIAHDFNNILAAITGYSELALHDSGSGLSGGDEIRQILKATDRAKDLVQQILAFSRKAAYDHNQLDLNQAITETNTMIQRTIPKMIQVELRLAPDLRTIRGDRTQIEQILLNLAANARDAMPEGGKLIIETCNITLDSNPVSNQLEIPMGGYVLLRVSDTGSGMDPEKVERVFEPFFTTKDIGKGTGLGLASVYGIVRSHGGQIRCCSELGQGTSFEIHLPVFKSNASTSDNQKIDSKHIALGTETILLVDDEPALRGVSSRLLEMNGYQVVTAASGEEALAVYRNQGQDLDLVIMDLGMPGMGGQKAFEQIIDINPKAKVIIASGYAADDTMHEILGSAVAGYIPKPFRKDELLAKVREVLDPPV